MFLEKFIQFSSQLYHYLLSPVCALCGYFTYRAYPICVDCQQDLPVLPHHCRRCAHFLPASECPDLICGACIKHPPPFDCTYALFPYQPPIIKLIVQLKFQHRLSAAQVLGTLLSEKIRKEWYANNPLPDLIIPIPLHPHRLRERGFNQSLEIARPVAKAFDIPLEVYRVKRIKHTTAQSSLSASLRKENIANAFISHRDYSGLFIAVLDDVITTGHTIRELCQTLKTHGANKIDVWCCARR